MAWKRERFGCYLSFRMGNFISKISFPILYTFHIVNCTPLSSHLDSLLGISIQPIFPKLDRPLNSNLYYFKI